MSIDMDHKTKSDPSTSVSGYDGYPAVEVYDVSHGRKMEEEAELEAKFG
jgi:hypothetical protein